MKTFFLRHLNKEKQTAFMQGNRADPRLLPMDVRCQKVREQRLKSSDRMTDGINTSVSDQITAGGVKAKGRHSEIEHRDSASMSPSRETAWWKPSQRRCEWRLGSWKAGVILRGRGQLKRCLQTEGKSGARGCCAWPHCLLCLCTAQECCTFKLLGTQRS